MLLDSSLGQSDRISEVLLTVRIEAPLATMTTCASVEAHASGSPRTVAPTEPDKSRCRLFLKEATELLAPLRQDLADLALELATSPARSVGCRASKVALSLRCI